MINKREDLITEIQELEFEISQLNSQEFEVQLLILLVVRFFTANNSYKET